MGTSSVVVSNTLILAAQYNDLRTDVRSTHNHNGTEGNAALAATSFTGTASVSGVQTHTADTIYNDAVDLVFGTDLDAQMRWSAADASNHALVLALDNTSQQFHITDVEAVGTDWDRSAGTHPELAIHSNTTPRTDYLTIGNHNGTTATIDVVGGTTLNLDIGGTNELALTATRMTMGVDIRLPSGGAIDTASGGLSLSPYNSTITYPTSTIIGGATTWEFDIATLVRQVVSNSGSTVKYLVHNTSNTASSRAVLQLQVGGVSAGDCEIQLNINGGQDWFIGLDNSASDQFTIGTGLPGTNDAVRLTVARAITFDDSTGSDFDYVCDECGRAELEFFSCCGPVRWHDDVLAIRNMRLSQQGLAHMVKLGVMELDGPEDSQPGWLGINFQKGMHMTWGGMWQLREMIDTLDQRLQKLGA